MAPVGVMHVVDSLRIGGAERVAVDLANLLPQDCYRPFLCTTREKGPLAKLVHPHVGRIDLHRRYTADFGAVRRLVDFIRANDIRILHAHASALFFARLAALYPPYPALIWHDHYGRYAFTDRPIWLYKLATRKVGGVIAVNQLLEKWSREALRVPPDRVWYIANLVRFEGDAKLEGTLPGEPGRRIVCVANIRPQKDHFNLLDAMQLLKAEMPDAHLLLVGDFSDKVYCDSVIQRIGELALGEHVSYLGARQDTPAILRACDIGVLGSRSEGLPLALLEYGMAEMATVVTNVGQCPEVVDGGAAGILVPPASPRALADALRSFLVSPERRREYAAAFKKRVETQYSAPQVVSRVCDVYRQVLK